MSMYGMLFGKNKVAPLILAALGLTENNVPRFRDCFIDGGKIAVYTRMGGGNRGHWEMAAYDEPGPGPGCLCPGCQAEWVLCGHSNYHHNEDDDFDSTYATYYFTIPERWRDVLLPMETDFDPDERWAAKLKGLETGDEPIPEVVTDLLREIATWANGH